VTEQTSIEQNEKVLAAVSHGSILLGLLTNGIGGVIVALVIWLTQKSKPKPSAYVVGQALQALVFQGITMIVTMLGWCCWGLLWMAMIVPPVIAHPGAYENTVPRGFWVGLSLIAIPLAIWVLTILYGLWGAVRCLGGHDFKYLIIGNWLEKQH
jgi:uncharacterized Tic20 family protein